MEIDILNHTGCRWSRIIYPGFRGYIKPQDKQEMLKSGGSCFAGALSPSYGSKETFSANFNDELCKLDGQMGGLRSHSKKPKPSQDMKVLIEA